MAWSVMLLLTSFMILGQITDKALAVSNSTISPSSTTTEPLHTAAPSTTATTSSAAPTTSKQIQPTPTTTAAASSSVSPDFETTLKAAVTYKGKCVNETTEGIKKWVEGFSKDYIMKGGYPIVEAMNSGEDCMVNITFMFAKGLNKLDVITRFINSSSNISGVELLKVKVDGVTLGKFKPSDAECKAKCCNQGGGGPIDLTRTCDPKIKCKFYIFKKTVKDCLNHCNKDLCSAGVSLKVSLVILIGVLINWVLKE